MAATLFQASQEGQLQTVKDILAENKPDVEAQDAEGFTALMLAARGGHVQVVQELLSSGAKPQSALEQDFSKTSPQIASMLSSAAESAQAATVAIDPQGGRQMPDGSVNYSQGAGFPAQPAEFQQQQYHFKLQHAHFDPTQVPDQRGPAPGNGAAANLPPPDVARMIPCKFFPNCRYGEKCIFAHPVPLAPNSASGPVSPGQGPVFYQPPPSYGYPPYGPPQHFYTMAPPMPMQYAHAGVSMPVHLPPPPHMGGPHVSEQPQMGQGEAFNPAFAPQRYYSPSQDNPGYGEAGQAPVDANDATAKPEDENAQASEATEADKNQAEAGVLENEGGKPVHRRQSFNSFLHHHAIPFQPGQMAMQPQPLNPDGTIAAPQQPFPRGSKGPRRGGASIGGSFSHQGFNKRAERPACYFFARGVCKHGEECHFPHILADGTDARGPNAGRPNASFDASRTPNRALAAKNGRNGSSQNGGQNSNASFNAPSGKKAASTTSVAKDGASASGNVSSENAVPAVIPVETSGSAPSSAEKAAPAAKQTENKENKDKAAPSSAPTPVDTPAASAADDPAASADKSAPASSAPSTSKDTSAAAPIPAKPTTTVNGTNNAQRSTAQQSNKQNDNGAKGVQQSFNGARQAYGKPGNNQVKQQNAQATKKVSQRVPDFNDFPALAGGPSSSTAAPAPASGLAQKVNFSTILSAPAPVRAKSTRAATEEPESEKSDAAATEKPSPDAQESASAEAKKSAVVPNRTSAPDFATIAQAKAVAV